MLWGIGGIFGYACFGFIADLIGRRLGEEYLYQTVQQENIEAINQNYPASTGTNPKVKLKDGSQAAGKRILIDGQQRVTALMAALLGQEVLTKDYETVHIRIAFHPQEEKFEVTNPAIRKDAAWIDDVADVFSPDAKLLQITRAYAAANPAAVAHRITLRRTGTGSHLRRYLPRAAHGLTGEPFLKWPKKASRWQTKSARNAPRCPVVFSRCRTEN